jgi:hypothetical protein
MCTSGPIACAVFDPARAQADHPIALRSKAGIVCHENERRASFRLQLEQKFDNAFSSGLIEIAGGFIRN